MNTRLAVAIWLFVAILLGAAGLLVDGLAVGMLLGMALALPSVWLCARLGRKAGLPLVVVFLLALSARWVVAVGVQVLLYREHPHLFAPDEFVYDRGGWWYAQYLHGRMPHPWNGGAVSGIIRLTGACYYFFGHEILIPKLVIGVIGAWTAAITALISARIFSARVAYRAGMLVALFPSLVLWSSLLIKDTDTLFAAELSLLAFLVLRERFSLGSLLLFAGGLFVMQFDRPYEVIFVALAVAASFVLQGDRRQVRNLVLFAIVSVLLIVVIKRSGADTAALGEGDASLVARLVTIRSGYASEGVGSAMNTQLVDTSTGAGLLLWVPIGLVYFFLAPLPGTGGSAIALSTTPEMLLFYYLLPSLWRSLRRELKRRSRPFMVVFFYLMMSSIGWSIAITNVGTVYRYRAQVMFVLLMLIAADQVRRQELKRATTA